MILDKTVKMPPRPPKPPKPSKLWLPGGGSLSSTATAATAPGKHLTDRRRRKESLSLYREILRTAKHFHWADSNGKPWNEQLKKQARKEFEEARHETDPLILARMLVTGRDCVHQIQNKFNEATQAAWKRIENDSSRRND